MGSVASTPAVGSKQTGARSPWWQAAGAAVMLLTGALYLAWFVERGWLPHDEGLIGQSADQVLRGALPHVGYSDAYTGGLSYLYAAAFGAFGQDLRTARWVLYAGALAALWLVFLLCRRSLPPMGAALATWVALGWSFPNYFAGLPSWWLTILAVVAVWALVRYGETQRREFLILAGLLIGLAVTVKQTGVYLAAAVVLALSLRASSARDAVTRSCASGIGVLAVAAGIAVTSGRFGWAEVLMLDVPLLALAIPLWRRGDPQGDDVALVRPVVLVGLAALVPVAMFLRPYLDTGSVSTFVRSAFIAPTSRLASASVGMREPGAVLRDAAPLLVLVLVSLSSTRRWSSAFVWLAAVSMPLLAIVEPRVYSAVWELARVLAVVVPVAAAWLVMTRRGASISVQTTLAACTMLAFLSLNQFPFAAAIYFGYTTPLLVVAAVAVAGQANVRPSALTPWAVLLVLFAAVDLNRSDIHALGQRYAPLVLDTPLNLPRAHLRIEGGEARRYWSLVTTVRSRLPRDGTLVAGPDCPEIYFLAERVHPRGVMYEFLAQDQPPPGSEREFDEWRAATVIVMNHQPEFSTPLSEVLIARLRAEFPVERRIDRYEVRWR